MKPISKGHLFWALVFFLATGEVLASTNADLFKPVPAGDSTYIKLQSLELAGLIPVGAADKTLTRYEVADLILNAQKNYKAIVVADANMAPSTPSVSPSVSDAMPSAAAADSAEDYSTPPPPSESVMNSDSTAAVATPPPVAPTPQPTPNYALHPELLVNAEAALKSLDEAYELELLAVMQAKGIMLDDLNKAEADQYQLWRDVKSITESPSVALHGVGRMFGFVQQIYGPFSLTGQTTAVTHIGGNAVTFHLPVTITNPETQYMTGYLDLNLSGTITKQLQWDSITRLGTSGLPLTGVFQYSNSFDTVNNVNYDTLNFRWIALHFSPDFMQVDLGDFYESYTPLTLWNRDNLDLYYKPEPIARGDDQYKYESFFNHEPDWPFRGIRLGTALGWPDSNILDRFKISGFVHMISNGFDDWPNNGFLFSPNQTPSSTANSAGDTNFFTDFIYAGQTDLELRKWFLGDMSVQLSMKAYLVILDELFNPNLTTDYLNYDSGHPGYSAAPVNEYIYNKFDPNTWAHQYRISSFKPEMKIGFGGDVYLGAQYEGSFAEYQDDKTNQARTVSDFAIFANPYLQFDDSKITFDYLNVGPNYYSPLAQSRQDFITPLSGTSTTALPGAGIFTAPLRGQYFLIDQRTVSGSTPIDYIDVPRANAIYSFYDRTQDNVFPYGLATPNRQGIGFDFDLKSMPDKAFKLPGAVYFLSEISGNLVVNSAGNGFTVVDALPNGAAPNRSFVYINVGPSYDFGPALQVKTPFELGTNIRYEQTNSQAGTLTDFWWLTGIRVGLFNWWDMTAAAGIKSAVGSDMGYAGTTLARYSYMYNNQDAGTYSVFTVNDAVTDLMFSTTFSLDSHSKLHFDYSLETGTDNGTSTPPASGLVPGATLTGTVNVQYTEVTYEVQF
jgi:hypothetical protein